MKAITVHRPWSYAIAHLGKDVENRRRQVKHRGTIAIHGGQVWSWDGAEFVERLTDHVFCPWDDYRDPAQAQGIVAVAELTGCHHATLCDRSGNGTQLCSPWAQNDAWHLILADVVALPEPVRCKGFLGLWTVPAEVEAEVVRQLAIADGVTA